MALLSPANRTGVELRPGRLQCIVAYCRDNGIWLISDEIYHGITSTGKAVTTLLFDDRLITINSFSNYYKKPLRPFVAYACPKRESFALPPPGARQMRSGADLHQDASRPGG